MKPRELWLATGNAKKRAELERLLADTPGIRLRLATELDPQFAPDESAADFRGNAAIKAAALARRAHGVALGDDSGLCVDALGGRPGVLSARYGGPGLGDRQRLERLLIELADVPDERRTAHFVCSLCLCGPDGSVRLAVEERCEGRLLTAARGAAGFGYDPIFVPDGLDPVDATRTFAELDPATKDRLSHRGQALRQLRAKLAQQPTLLDA